MSRHDMLVRIAEVVAERSSCSRAAVGCLIVRDGRIMATGYNGAPSGMPHCEHECTCPDQSQGMVRRKGCPRHDPLVHCSLALHAEANALVFAARHGVATDGAQLYTTMAPCLNCAGLIINAGINWVWCGDAYSNPDGINLLLSRKMAVASADPA